MGLLGGCGGIFSDLAYMGMGHRHHHSYHDDYDEERQERAPRDWSDQELTDELARRNKTASLEAEVAALRQELQKQQAVSKKQDESWADF